MKPLEPPDSTYIKTVECLSRLQWFETCWAYYFQTETRLFEDEVRDAAKLLLESYKAVSTLLPDLQPTIQRELQNSPDASGAIQRLEHWISKTAPYPLEGSPLKNQWDMFEFCAAFKAILTFLLGLPNCPSTTPLEAFRHSASSLRWKPHLSEITRSRFRDPDGLIKKCSEFPSIVIVADIRNSQDLMTYATSQEQCAEDIGYFYAETTRLVNRHNAVLFDKFTGDGFLLYFNEKLSRTLASDYIADAVRFLQNAMDTFAPVFARWSFSVRKVSSKHGIGIGADWGLVRFQFLRNHFIATGDAIVWATRMADAADGGEILVNNLLYHELKPIPCLEFSEKSCKTKKGDEVLGRQMTFKTQTGMTDACLYSYLAKKRKSEGNDDPPAPSVEGT
ncbi:MAG: hypothetical protein HY360_14475 [Verrucomicrobia bacterium]|nr:hypothetical protein [Verrucomicrobiota bacterium]